MMKLESLLVGTVSPLRIALALLPGLGAQAVAYHQGSLCDSLLGPRSRHITVCPTDERSIARLVPMVAPTPGHTGPPG